MAKITKKWGVVIGCWVVTLALVITGITLGLTVPSSAADEALKIAVMFDADGDGTISATETTTYSTLHQAFTAANTYVTTAEKPVTVKLLSDVGHDTWNYNLFVYNNCVFDLNGCAYLLDYQAHTSNSLVVDGGTLQIIDSRPEVLRYFTYAGADAGYQIATAEADGAVEVRGGVLAVSGVEYGIVVSATRQSDHGAGKVIIDGGTFLGKTHIQSFSDDACQVVINKGNIQLHAASDTNLYSESIECHSGKITINDGVVYGGIKNTGVIEINGGTICGNVLAQPDFPQGLMEQINEVVNAGYESGALDENADPAAMFDYCVANGIDRNELEKVMSGYYGEYQVVDLSKPQFNFNSVKVDPAIRMKAYYDEAGNFTHYQAVDASEYGGGEEPENPDKPITTPDESQEETKNDATKNDNSNLIGLIILGGAAAVMVIGVVTIIVINVKRGKRKNA